MSLAERLIEAREEHGWNKAELRRRAKIKSPSTITELESGKRTESPQLPVIAEALGVEIIWLQHGRGPKYRNTIEVQARRVNDKLEVEEALPLPARIALAVDNTQTDDEKLLLDGFKVATKDIRHVMLQIASDSIARFSRRSDQQ